MSYRFCCISDRIKAGIKVVSNNCNLDLRLDTCCYGSHTPTLWTRGLRQPRSEHCSIAFHQDLFSNQHVCLWIEVRQFLNEKIYVFSPKFEIIFKIFNLIYRNPHIQFSLFLPLWCFFSTSVFVRFRLTKSKLNIFYHLL